MHKRIDKKRKLHVIPEKTHFEFIRLALEQSSLPEKSLLLGHLRSRSIETLIRWSQGLNPQLYDSASDYFEAAQISSLIKKVPFPKKCVPNLDPRKEGLDKFRASEERCRATNLAMQDDPLDRVVLHARHFIECVIGLEPPLVSILKKASITTGACVGVNGSSTNVGRKLLSKRWTVTSAARYYGYLMIGLNDQWAGLLRGYSAKNRTMSKLGRSYRRKVEVVTSNKITLVPKTATSERTIAIEPFINSCLQGGVDKFMKERLKQRTNINLYDQSRNQELARIGSVPTQLNPYVTIDLESASDTLAKEVVRRLVPSRWFSFLDDLRSHFYEMDGQNFLYEKFCSMGNGFCFPLETLIFSSLIYGVMKESEDPFPVMEKGSLCIDSEVLDFSVYGDDIICRSRISKRVIEVLNRFGFSVNTRKSFLEGPFRESCGADWFLGEDVRPVVVTKYLSKREHVVALHNAFYRSPTTEEWITPSLLKFLRDTIPAQALHLRPGREPGDTAFSVPLDLFMACSTSKWNRETFSWSWTEVIPVPVCDEGLVCSGGFARALSYGMMQGCKSEAPFALRYTEKRRRSRVCRPYKDGWHGQSFSDSLTNAPKSF